MGWRYLAFSLKRRCYPVKYGQKRLLFIFDMAISNDYYEETP